MYDKNVHASYRTTLSRPGSTSSGYDTSPEYDSQSNSAQAVTTYGHSTWVDAHHGTTTSNSATNKTVNPTSGQTSRVSALHQGGGDPHGNGRKYGERDMRNGADESGKRHARVGSHEGKVSRRDSHDPKDGHTNLNGVPYATSMEFSSSSPPRYSASQGSVGEERGRRDHARVRDTWGEGRDRDRDYDRYSDNREQLSAGRVHLGHEERENSANDMRVRSDVADSVAPLRGELGASNMNPNGYHHDADEGSESPRPSCPSLSPFSSTTSLPLFADNSTSPLLRAPCAESRLAVTRNHDTEPDLSQATDLCTTGPRVRVPGRHAEPRDTVHTAYNDGRDRYSTYPAHDKSSPSQGWHVRTVDTSHHQHKHVQPQSSPMSGPGTRTHHPQPDVMNYNNRAPDTVKNHRRSRSQNGRAYLGHSNLDAVDRDDKQHRSGPPSDEPSPGDGRLSHSSHSRSSPRKEDSIGQTLTDTASTYVEGAHPRRLANGTGARGHSDLYSGGSLNAVKSRREELERCVTLRITRTHVQVHAYIHTHIYTNVFDCQISQRGSMSRCVPLFQNSFRFCFLNYFFIYFSFWNTLV
jgi:hypothetical protein